MFVMITALAYQPEIWLILGLICVLLELTDGSTIFFLPLGLGAVLMALWVYLFNEAIIPSFWLSPKWYFTVLIWAVLALIISFCLQTYKRRHSANRQGEDGDINDY